ncbi:MAG: prephenate dehydratase, partial [Christensenellaceae bacterium]
MKVGYLGPVGSYSFLAAGKLCPGDRLIPYANFMKIVSATVRGETDACVLPVENSLQGAVLQNLDLLQANSLFAVEEYVLKIEHKLIWQNGTRLEDVRRIYSHDQAIGQCARFLTEVIPYAEVVAVESTAKGAAMLRLPSDACIAGSQLLREGLSCYEGEIADDPNNFTHFLLFKRDETDVKERTDRIFLTAICKNKPGALLHLLHIISDKGLNMTKIESR